MCSLREVCGCVCLRVLCACVCVSPSACVCVGCVVLFRCCVLGCCCPSRNLCVYLCVCVQSIFHEAHAEGCSSQVHTRSRMTHMRTYTYTAHTSTTHTRIHTQAHTPHTYTHTNTRDPHSSDLNSAHLLRCLYAHRYLCVRMCVSCVCVRV